MEYSSDELRRLLEEETDLSDLEVFELALAKSPANLETDFLMLKEDRKSVV